jgi:hypothetical protein
MFIETDDLVRAPKVVIGQLGAPAANGAKLAFQPLQGTPSGFPLQLFPQGLDYGVGDRLAGDFRQLPSQHVRLGVLNIERHRAFFTPRQFPPKY